MRSITDQIRDVLAGQETVPDGEIRGFWVHPEPVSYASSLTSLVRNPWLQFDYTRAALCDADAARVLAEAHAEIRGVLMVAAGRALTDDERERVVAAAVRGMGKFNREGEDDEEDSMPV